MRMLSKLAVKEYGDLSKKIITHVECATPLGDLIKNVDSKSLKEIEDNLTESLSMLIFLHFIQGVKIE